MPKFPRRERNLIKNIVANLTIKRISDQEIIKVIFNQTSKTISDKSLRYIRQSIKRESFKWYKTMREGEYEYIHEFKERINEILDLQRKVHEILDDEENKHNPQIRLNAISELHKLSITLSNLYDVAPTIIGVGPNATISTASQTKTSSTETTESDIIV